MRTILTLLCLVLPLAAGAQTGDEPGPAPKPRVFALVSAMGDGFNLVVEKQSTGSHLAPYARERVEAADAINFLVLRELARQVAAADSTARFVPMVFPVPPMPKVAARDQPQAIFDAAAAELKSDPDRRTWDRILIVTPAYRAPRKDGMASQLGGMGLFIEPLCVTDQLSCENGVAALSGPQAQRPDGSVSTANSFFAPYFYVTLWELDAATMEVIAKRDVFQHQKMASDNELAPAKIDAAEAARINVQLASLVTQSVKEALKKTDLAGRVEARGVQEVKPEDAGTSRP